MSSRMEDDSERGEATCSDCGHAAEWEDCPTCEGGGGRYRCPLGCGVLIAVPTADEKLEKELRRWQEAIREAVIKHSGAPDHIIDGGGCDSGDPLDLTLAEIAQGFAYVRGER
jgi:hypothetical protein